MTKPSDDSPGIPRREFLQFLGATGTVLALEPACTFLRPVDEGNPLARRVARDW